MGSKLDIALMVVQLGGNVTDPKLKKAAEKIILDHLNRLEGKANVEPEPKKVVEVKKTKKKTTEPKGEDNGNV